MNPLNPLRVIEELGQGVVQVLKSFPSLWGTFLGRTAKGVEPDRVLNKLEEAVGSRENTEKKPSDYLVTQHSGVQSHIPGSNVEYTADEGYFSDDDNDKFYDCMSDFGSDSVKEVTPEVADEEFVIAPESPLDNIENGDLNKTSMPDFPTPQELIKNIAVELGAKNKDVQPWGYLAECTIKDFYTEVLESYREPLFASAPAEVVEKVIGRFSVNRELVNSLEELYYFNDNGSRIPLVDICEAILLEMKADGLVRENNVHTMDFLQSIVTLEKQRMDSGADDIKVGNQTVNIKKAFAKLGVKAEFMTSYPAGQPSSEKTHFSKAGKAGPRQSFSRSRYYENHFNFKSEEKAEQHKRESSRESKRQEANAAHNKTSQSNNKFDAGLLDWGKQVFGVTDCEYFYPSQVVFYGENRAVEGMLFNHKGKYVLLKGDAIEKSMFPGSGLYYPNPETNSALKDNEYAFDYYENGQAYPAKPKPAPTQGSESAQSEVPPLSREFEDWILGYQGVPWDNYEQVSPRAGYFTKRVGDEDIITKVVYQCGDGVFRILDKKYFGLIDSGIFLPTDYSFQYLYKVLPGFDPSTGDRYEYSGNRGYQDNNNEGYKGNNDEVFLQEVLTLFGLDYSLVDKDKGQLKKECRNIIRKVHPDKTNNLNDEELEKLIKDLGLSDQYKDNQRGRQVGVRDFILEKSKEINRAFELVQGK